MDLIKNVYLNLVVEILRVTILVIFCHFAGDYLLQTDYMAKEKGNDWWVMLAHCFCYSLPFYVIFEMRWQLFLVLSSHFIIDSGECKNWYGTFFDQCFHIVVAMTYIFPVFTEGNWRLMVL